MVARTDFPKLMILREPRWACVLPAGASLEEGRKISRIVLTEVSQGNWDLTPSAFPSELTLELLFLGMGKRLTFSEAVQRAGNLFSEAFREMESQQREQLVFGWYPSLGQAIKKGSPEERTLVVCCQDQAWVEDAVKVLLLEAMLRGFWDEYTLGVLEQRVRLFLRRPGGFSRVPECTRSARGMFVSRFASTAKKAPVAFSINR